MKHWSELSELESAIIRVGEFKNLFKLLVAGAENDVDMKVVQSAIYTLEGMIDDIDSTLYEKFQTVWDCVRNDEEPEEEFELNISTMADVPPLSTYGSDTITITPYEYQGSTVHINSTSEEDEAFKELEKAIKNWHQASK